MRKLLLISALALCGQVSEAATSWNVNDVSVLFDLPSKTEGLEFLIGAEASGKKGELLPASAHQLMTPLMLGVIDQPSDEYKSLRVIAARIDPCFKYTTSDSCYPQLRLVWQPIGKDKSGTFTSFDAGIHSFYELSQVEWKNLVSRMSALKAKFEKHGVRTDTPLSVHPALNLPSTRSEFMKEMKAIIVEFAGKQNLSRATFMKLFTPEIWWVFGGFEFRKHEAIRMELPRHEKKEDQNFFNDDFNASLGMKGSFVPALVNPSNKDDLSELLKDYSYTFTSTEGRKYVKKSLETLDRIENPAHFTPETIDCAHCHVTQATRAYLSHRDKEFYKANNKTPFRYQGMNLSNTSANLNNPKSMRIFGFLGKTTAISQRVINESADVAALLNRKFSR